MRNRIVVYVFASAVFALPLAVRAQSDSGDSGHVPPPPPAQPMPPMSDAAMEQVMDMHDDPLLAMLKLDQLERAFGDRGAASAWEAEAWIGHDFDKLWLRTEGERENGASDVRIEAFWDHAFASWWDWQLGVRHDGGSGPRASAARDWAAFGIQGIAPYWFEIEATAYLGDNGRTAARLRAEYELLLTQRLVLQPELEANVYGRRDRARAIDAGFNDIDLGVRLRYEIRREFAPYIGIVRRWRFADSGITPAHSGTDTQVVAGVRVWF